MPGQSKLAIILSWIWVRVFDNRQALKEKRTERNFTVGRPFSWRWIEQLLLLVTKQSNGYQNKKENRPQKDRRHRILIWNGTEKWPRMNRERIVSLSATYHKSLTKRHQCFKCLLLMFPLKRTRREWVPTIWTEQHNKILRGMPKPKSLVFKETGSLECTSIGTSQIVGNISDVCFFRLQCYFRWKEE